LPPITSPAASPREVGLAPPVMPDVDAFEAGFGVAWRGVGASELGARWDRVREAAREAMPGG
jgi:hypothetical protein